MKRTKMSEISFRRETLRYPPEFDADFKRGILERDNYTCALCGKRKEKLDVHHIDYTRRTVRTNCISLCRPCHNRLHWHKTWAYRDAIKFRFYALVAQREGLTGEVEGLHIR